MIEFRHPLRIFKVRKYVTQKLPDLYINILFYGRQNTRILIRFFSTIISSVKILKSHFHPVTSLDIFGALPGWKTKQLTRSLKE